MASRDNFDLADQRARNLRSDFPTALAARYDRRWDRVVVRLNSGLDIAFLPQATQGLEDAKFSQLRKIEISPSGFGLYFPELDADIYLPALLKGFLGSKKWMAARLGTVGGKSRSSAKVAAARQNGKLGGRPRALRKSRSAAASD
jgi:Protein of unknown function (DUF2442)